MLTFDTKSGLRLRFDLDKAVGVAPIDEDSWTQLELDFEVWAQADHLVDAAELPVLYVELVKCHNCFDSLL